jgi:FkbM family methyltransferase
MSPGFDELESIAAASLKSVPDGVTRGEISAGLYGLGFLGRWALPRLKARGVRLTACYDANMTLHGTLADSLPVLAPGQLKISAPEFVFITARHAVVPVSAALTDLGIQHVSYDAWHVAADIAAFRRVHDKILRDRRSQEVLRSVLMAMLTGDTRHCAAVFERDQYFCLPQFCGGSGEIYVDAGAFVGDSVERFIWAHNGAFSKIYAFEPGPRQFAALQSRTKRLIEEWALAPASLSLVNAGLGEAEGSATAQSDSGQLTSLAIGGASAALGTTVGMVSLDGFLRSERVTFLKADVEGMELALLKGARSMIQRDRPKISVCVYHYPADITEISNYLSGLVPDYQFALRHHSPQLMETVLYCWTD